MALRKMLFLPSHIIQTPDPRESLVQSQWYVPEEYFGSQVEYLECPLAELVGFAQE